MEPPVGCPDNGELLGVEHEFNELRCIEVRNLSDLNLYKALTYRPHETNVARMRKNPTTDTAIQSFFSCMIFARLSTGIVGRKPGMGGSEFGLLRLANGFAFNGTKTVVLGIQ